MEDTLSMGKELKMILRTFQKWNLKNLLIIGITDGTALKF